ncbi:MAG TPA: CocE/NonD family hydrolase [Bacteroidales bacterium]|nr:CocE/NonD family hydrolase [Bacteroidales bacterium]
MTKFLCFIFICISIHLNAQVYFPIIDSIPMRDGKKLAVDIYIADTTQSLPTILVQTPYNRILYRWGLPIVGSHLYQNQYNFVIADWRGFYGSASAYVANYNRGLDGYDLVEWIAQQTWSNGKIGTWGPSALGKIQYQTAKENPPHLTCCVPIVAFPQMTYQEYYPGGVYRTEYVQQLDNLGYGLSPWLLANPFYNFQWQYVESTTNYPSAIKVPLFMIGGWYDHNIDGMISFFKAIRQSSVVASKHKLLMGPWVHGGHGSAYVGSCQQGELTFDNACQWSDSLALRFFDFYLRNMNNGWENEPVFRYYQIGNNQWLESSSIDSVLYQNQTYFFQPNGLLSQNSPTGINDFGLYLYNPADPSPTHGGCTLRTDLLQGPYDQSQTVEARNDILVFSSEYLLHDIEIFGKPNVHLWVSSDRKDTDFSIRLCDVYPDGRSMLISDGIQRMRFRNGYTVNDTVSMQANAYYAIDIELPYVAYTFLEGHKIRIDITSSNYPRYDNNLNNGLTMYAAGDTLIATNKVYFNQNHSSFLTIPVKIPTIINENTVNAINVFPNPVDDYIYINGMDAIESITLTDILGRSTLLPLNTQYNVADLKSGVYFLTIRLKNGNKHVEKVVKK